MRDTDQALIQSALYSQAYALSNEAKLRSNAGRTRREHRAELRKESKRLAQLAELIRQGRLDPSVPESFLTAMGIVLSSSPADDSSLRAVLESANLTAIELDRMNLAANMLRMTCRTMRDEAIARQTQDG